ncbi:hypothetical protein B0T16DRAFT_189705 [Cercophora newfieldiana]|uniref:Uncharacterized protein n=1 Tax=Cercophora newfieldiana TaxID=92897 RepID=A0AA39Y0W1_9PEZI|nr:hypothetical protein B0T16DRAFT_189705 [Cercophora newfieldiana]
MGIASYPPGKTSRTVEPTAHPAVVNRKRQTDSVTTSKITISQTITRVSSTWTAVATLQKDLPSEPPAQSAPLVTGKQLGGILGGVGAAVIICLMVGCFWFTSRPKRHPRSYSTSSTSSFSFKRPPDSPNPPWGRPIGRPSFPRPYFPPRSLAHPPRPPESRSSHSSHRTDPGTPTRRGPAPQRGPSSPTSAPQQTRPPEPPDEPAPSSPQQRPSVVTVEPTPVSPPPTATGHRPATGSGRHPNPSSSGPRPSGRRPTSGPTPSSRPDTQRSPERIDVVEVSPPPAPNLRFTALKLGGGLALAELFKIAKDMEKSARRHEREMTTERRRRPSVHHV